MDLLKGTGGRVFAQGLVLGGCDHCRVECLGLVEALRGVDDKLEQLDRTRIIVGGVYRYIGRLWRGKADALGHARNDDNGLTQPGRLGVVRGLAKCSRRRSLKEKPEGLDRRVPAKCLEAHVPGAARA